MTDGIFTMAHPYLLAHSHLKKNTNVDMGLTGLLFCGEVWLCWMGGYICWLSVVIIMSFISKKVTKEEVTKL